MAIYGTNIFENEKTVQATLEKFLLDAEMFEESNAVLENDISELMPLQEDFKSAAKTVWDKIIGAFSYIKKKLEEFGYFIKSKVLKIMMPKNIKSMNDMLDELLGEDSDEDDTDSSAKIIPFKPRHESYLNEAFGKKSKLSKKFSIPDLNKLISMLSDQVFAEAFKYNKDAAIALKKYTKEALDSTPTDDKGFVSFMEKGKNIIEKLAGDLNDIKSDPDIQLMLNDVNDMINAVNLYGSKSPQLITTTQKMISDTKNIASNYEKECREIANDYGDKQYKALANIFNIELKILTLEEKIFNEITTCATGTKLLSSLRQEIRSRKAS